MFYGMFLSTIGTSMIWPFLMIYVSEKLDQPLTAVAFLLTINSAVSLGAAFIAGPITDRLGRKWILIISLVGNGLVYLLLGQATTLVHFAFLMAFRGLFTPLYRVGGDAMLADLVEPDQRPDAFALLRMSFNVGISIGPAVGGFIATTSYAITFICAAVGLTSYGLLLLFFARETLPMEVRTAPKPQDIFKGYGQIFRDGPFMLLVCSFSLALMSIIPIWVLMSVYAKTEFGIPESQFGLIATTNALMVVFFQLAVTQRTKRYSPIPIMTLGTVIYAMASGCVSLATGFWGFWLCMVLMTTGELILVPTASTFAANLAPADMRGRYMSIYGLTWGVASGIAPPLGGFLSDTFGSQFIWYGAALMGFAGVLSFLLLGQVVKKQQSLVNLNG
jgi:MFS family permease